MATDITQEAVDVGALRAFQTLWKPVLDTIPAVLTAVERKADIDRAIAQYQRDADAARDTTATIQQTFQRNPHAKYVSKASPFYGCSRA